MVDSLLSGQSGDGAGQAGDEPGRTGDVTAQSGFDISGRIVPYTCNMMEIYKPPISMETCLYNVQCVYTCLYIARVFPPPKNLCVSHL